MQKSLKKIESKNQTVWMTQPKEELPLLEKQQTAFDIAIAKLNEHHGNVEFAMQTAEAFGRGLFAEHIKNKPDHWTMKEWLEQTTEHIFNPLGTGATITSIKDDNATTKLYRNLLNENAEHPEIASLFTYGALRGMFLSAFPKGEILMKSAIAQGAPMTELVFKITATPEEKLERERVKTNLSVMKKE